ncbi:MAG: HAD-IIA family hydrolase [Planctomycetota bacterium]|nr:HAD-IIA family hydrolase [Planctomycetota bacterium]
MNIKSFLIDIDGTLYDGDQVIPGGPEAIAELRKRGLPFLLVTNTTRIPKSAIMERLRRLSYEISEDEVFPVPIAAVKYVRDKNPEAVCYMMASEDTEAEFRDAGLQVHREERPSDFVIIGQKYWLSFGEIDIAFRLVRDGAEAVSLHRDMTYPENGVIHVGLGPVVIAMEALTKKPVTIIGKPNPRFFDLSLQKAGFTKDGAVMIGDNFDGDTLGALNAGLKAIQVKTGSYDEQTISDSKIKPTWTLGSIRELCAWLDEKSGVVE